MKIVVAGGTGFIGEALARGLVARGDVAVLTRNASHASPEDVGPNIGSTRWGPADSTPLER